MFAPKPISHSSVASALLKAERYRLLNEPGEAESICRDILALEPANQSALISLILSLTDQIPEHPEAWSNALAVVPSLDSAYNRAYYAGIAWERRAKARYRRMGHSAHDHVYDWVVCAMRLFEEAEKLRAPNNDDSILRWNACVRFLAANKEIKPRTEEMAEPLQLE